MKTILEATGPEAKDFLLQADKYCGLRLPPYFDLDSAIQCAIPVVDQLRSKNPDRPLDKILKASVSNDVNHKILTNKDGAFAWRSFQIIHPVLYVSLVETITKEWERIVERFKLFQSNDKIKCHSIPIWNTPDGPPLKDLSIGNWWANIEQESIRLSLDYKYLATTDITDCYSSLYTHTVAWALHEKDVAKKKRNDEKLLGNAIDKQLQAMQNSQTNGIPQGNVVSDLIAELVLGYADLKLEKMLSNESESLDYKILRYRDDYRIFTQSPGDSKMILQHLSSVLSDLNFKLNSSKTSLTSDVITGSIKPDKLHWLGSIKRYKSLSKSLILIRKIAKEYPNSGSVTAALGDVRKRLEKVSERPEDNEVLIAVVADIMYLNPITYPTSASILSKLLEFEEEKNAQDLLGKLSKKFGDVPNVGILNIWLQRISITYDTEIGYSEGLCELVTGSKETIWNSDWLELEEQDVINRIQLVDKSKITATARAISLHETESFLGDSYDFSADWDY